MRTISLRFARAQNEFLSRLICFKHKSFQVVMNPNTKNPLEGDRTNVADIFYYIDKEMVVVDEMNRQQQFEKVSGWVGSESESESENGNGNWNAMQWWVCETQLTKLIIWHRSKSR